MYTSLHWDVKQGHDIKMSPLIRIKQHYEGNVAQSHAKYKHKATRWVSFTWNKSDPPRILFRNNT